MNAGAMSAKHTPGPWERVSSAEWNGAHVIDAHGRIVAVCDGCDTPGASGEVGVDEARANAYLIAAAPDLLAALEAVDRADVYIHERGAAMLVVRNAIAKARGEA